MDRCYRKNAANFKSYGGRGISVCEEWHDISVFEKWAIENGYKNGLTLDRIDTNGNYCPENCRWATPKQQANNRRNTVFVTIEGVTKTLSEWAEIAGVRFSTMSDRYHCKGIRGKDLLRPATDTRFQKGYNRYKNPKHWSNAPTILEAEGGGRDGN